MTEKRWIVPPEKPEIERKLAKACGIGILTARVLYNRGIDTPDKVKDFLSAAQRPLTCATELTDMTKAAERIRRAIEKKETVAVVGDYDADGITALYLLSDYLRNKGLTVYTHIPDRAAEGYGVSIPAVQRFAQKGAELILTVDTGITAFDAAELCKKLHIDFIVTDHHACKDILPDAVAVVDPWRPDSPEKFHGLAGVGVAFKLICAVENGNDNRLLSKYADVLCVGTVADVMPITGENRRFTTEGLKKLASDPNRGLASLLRATGAEVVGLDTQVVSFRLAPRINAAGRVSNAEPALRLLEAKDDGEADRYAKELCDLNIRRQELEQIIRKDAEQMLQKQGFDAEKDGVIFLVNESWHPGVVGIVCARLADQYGCPAVLATKDGDRLKASARSVKGFHLYNALTAVSDHLEQFGGHELAAGLTLYPKQAEGFGNALRAYARKNMKDNPNITSLQADCIAHPGELTESAVRDLTRLEPYGGGNPMPLFFVPGLHVESITGLKENRHTRLAVNGEDRSLTGIFFGRAPGMIGVCAGETAENICTLAINEYRGKCSVNMYLRDIRSSDGATYLLWSELSIGNEISPEEALRILPEREDFARIWRELRQGENFAEKTSLPGDGQNREICRGKLCAALQVLQEAGLVKKSDGGFVSVLQVGKVDLEDCPTQKKLRSLVSCG